ncbi:MAG: hypothetical protein LRZ85_08055 [Alphaproteobacteria bacterium]|nr:hypothetical protein [Alphaproteobacteria bacterium]
MKLGKKGKWAAGALAAAGVAGGWFASYNDVRDDLLRKEQPLIGQLHKSEICAINATAREYVLHNAGFKTNKALQGLLRSTGLQVDVMIPEVEIGERELSSAMSKNLPACEDKHGKPGLKHVTDTVSYLSEKMGEIAIALGLKTAFVFAAEHIYLPLFVENEHGPAPDTMVAEISPKEFQKLFPKAKLLAAQPAPAAA